MRRAVLTLDVEDWFHLDYFDRNSCDLSKSSMDGLSVFLDVLDRHSIKASFFVLGEIAEANIDFFSALVEKGHDVGSHGWRHTKPLTISLAELSDELEKCFQVLKKINGNSDFGYRAPCFSMDRERLDIVKSIGFAYDSSRINFESHPLYGSLDMSGFQQICPDIYRQNDFFEFEVATTKILGRQIPISGGGYLRIFPWLLSKSLLRRHLATGDIYSLYLHPFELSKSYNKPPQGTPLLTALRYKYGRSSVRSKLDKVIAELQRHDYEFTTFKEIRREFIKQTQIGSE